MALKQEQRRYLRPAVFWALFPSEAQAEEARRSLLERGASQRDLILVPGPTEEELRGMEPHPGVPQELKPGQAALVVKLTALSREQAEEALSSRGALRVHFSDAVALEDQTSLKVRELVKEAVEVEDSEEADIPSS